MKYMAVLAPKITKNGVDRLLPREVMLAMTYIEMTALRTTKETLRKSRVLWLTWSFFSFFFRL